MILMSYTTIKTVTSSTLPVNPGDGSIYFNTDIKKILVAHPDDWMELDYDQIYDTSSDSLPEPDSGNL